MLQVVARAVELGINYFDTAALYGDGKSETNLGAVLAELGLDVIVGTKVQLKSNDFADIPAAITQSVETSLRRLRRETIDLMQLHNVVTSQRQPDQRSVTVEDIAIAMQTFERLHAEGKIQHWGWNGLGETAALHQAFSLNAHTIQSCYNLINPSAGQAVPATFPFQNYGQLIDKATDKGMGVIAIRILAGGALSGSATRHPNAMQVVDPIASHTDFSEDVAWAQRFHVLQQKGYVESLIEAAIRFAIGKAEISTALVGISNMEQLEQAVAAANKGALPPDALSRLQQIYS
jgi:aryl-alcohol dehydrogenase-like predicted oxidoreductase